MTSVNRAAIDVPDRESGDEFATALNVLLHELRTPLSVAQGYLRLLLENRLSDPTERQRAINQSMEALGRISAACAVAGEFANGTPSVDAHQYEAAELVEALQREAQERGFRIDVRPSTKAGRIRTLLPKQATAAIVLILQSALAGDQGQLRISVGFDDSDLRVTVGDTDTWERAIVSSERAALNPWRHSHGLSLALAMKRLTGTGARIWAPASEPKAASIAFPVEWHS